MGICQDTFISEWRDHTYLAKGNLHTMKDVHAQLDVVTWCPILESKSDFCSTLIFWLLLGCSYLFLLVDRTGMRECFFRCSPPLLVSGGCLSNYPIMTVFFFSAHGLDFGSMSCVMPTTVETYRVAAFSDQPAGGGGLTVRPGPAYRVGK